MTGYKIIWADDEIDLLTPYLLFLREKGYEVTPVSNGLDALDALERGPYDVVLLDENMPGLSGLDTLTRINMKYPALPVIMITKSEEEDIMNKAIGDSIADYLIKPVNPNQILLSLKKILAGKALVSSRNSSGYQKEYAGISEDIDNASTFKDWEEIYGRLVSWEIKLENSDLSELVAQQKKDADKRFAGFIRKDYLSLLDSGSPLSPEIMKKKIFPTIDSGEKVCFILIDNFRMDQWRVIKPLLAEEYDIHEETAWSILPTSTQYARNSIFAGMMPLDISKKYPRLWVGEGENREGMNLHEEELLDLQIKRERKDWKFSYTKINDSASGDKFLSRIHDYRDYELNAVVLNFIDMMSHTRTESRMMRELANTDAAYRSITLSWWKHSPLPEMIKSFARLGFRIFMTSDHGTIRVETPLKVIGEREINSNLRYKEGRNLKYNKKDVFEMKQPELYGLPSPNLSSTFIFAADNDFFVYPNNQNHFVKYYTGTYQHGGVSLEEMLVPLVSLTSRR